jgi:phosphatidylserine decarboxylase
MRSPWFEHGSTIIVLAPDHFAFCDNVMDSARINAGQPLMRRARGLKPV